VSFDVASIVERARLAAAKPGGEAGGSERQRLERIAQEFESMLLVQVLRDMRKAGAWDEEGEGEGLGAESMFETLDVELATHLSRIKGLGLSKELLTAFDRMHRPSRRNRWRGQSHRARPWLRRYRMSMRTITNRRTCRRRSALLPRTWALEPRPSALQ
jgi:Rod binding domain-containing protein